MKFEELFNEPFQFSIDCRHLVVKRLERGTDLEIELDLLDAHRKIANWFESYVLQFQKSKSFAGEYYTPVNRGAIKKAVVRHHGGWIDGEYFGNAWYLYSNSSEYSKRGAKPVWYIDDIWDFFKYPQYLDRVRRGL